MLSFSCSRAPSSAASTGSACTADLVHLSALTFASKCLIPTYQSLYSSDRMDLDQIKIRQETFICWPSWVPASVRPKDLAEAGFCYTGDGDQTRCFSCSVKVSHWKAGDDPWTIHRDRSPRCSFLKQQQRTSANDLDVDGEGDLDSEDCLDGASIKQFNQFSRTMESSKPQNKICRESSCLVSSEAKVLGHHQSAMAVTTMQKHSEKLQVPAKEETKQFLSTKQPPYNKKALKEENERLRNAMMCQECKKEKVQTLFLPCRHLVSCEECAEKMNDCILCKERILGTVRTYFG